MMRRSQHQQSPLQQAIEACITGINRKGLEVRFIDKEIGHGLFVSRSHSFKQGDFLVQYQGELLSLEEAARKEKTYSEAEATFMYYFSDNGKKLCLDGSLDPFGLNLGRMANDAYKINENAKMKIVITPDGMPNLCLFALKDIPGGTEIRFDYGVKDNPWRLREKADKRRKRYPSHLECPPGREHGKSAKSDLPNESVSASSKVQILDASVELSDLTFTGCLKKTRGHQNIYANVHSRDCLARDGESMAVAIQDDVVEDSECDSVQFGMSEPEDSNHSYVYPFVGNEELPTAASCKPTDGILMDNSRSKQNEELPTAASCRPTDGILMDNSQSKQNEELPTAASCRPTDSILMDNSRSKQNEELPTAASCRPTDGILMDNSQSKQNEELPTAASCRPTDSILMDNSRSKQNEELPTAASCKPTDGILMENSQSKQNEELPTAASCRPTDGILMENSQSKQNEELPTAASCRPTDGILMDNSQSKQKKPDRYCIYCKSHVKGVKLKRHIIRRHKDVEEVSKAVSLPKQLMNEFFNQKRCEGIYAYNLSQMKDPAGVDSNSLMRERSPKFEDELRMCSGCNRFFSSRSFYKHKQDCSSVTAGPMRPTLLWAHDYHKDQEFVNNILCRFRDTECGRLCRSDDLIKQVGYRHYCLRRHEKSKSDEIRKCVMTEMRELGRLFLIFKSIVSSEVTTEDMFTRHYLAELREAVEAMANPVANQKEKHGLKLNVNAIIQRTIKSLKGFYSETMCDEKVHEVEKFQLAYSFRSAEMFSGARYQCVTNSLDLARRPEALPEKDSLIRLKSFIASELKVVMSQQELSNYAFLRSLIVCRLTLYNGRRGDEPSRMLMSEWQDAVDGAWLPPDDVESIEDEAEKFLVGQFRLAYLHGKGRKYVPVLIPEDLVEPISYLVSHREQHGIRNDNVFLFATKSSISHCSGWHAVRDIAKAAGVQINATRNCHRISTLYASLDMSENDRQIFLDHMGHEERINKENYQCPQGVKEVQVMGRILEQMDNGHNVFYKGISSTKTFGKRKTMETNAAAAAADDNDDDEQDFMDRTGKRRRVIIDDDDDDDDGDDDDHDDKQRSDLEQRKVATVHWTEVDTALLRRHFQAFFLQCTMMNDNCGKLPSKQDIIRFLSANTLGCLSHLGTTEAYKKVRTKLFNDRKTIRTT